MSMHSLHQHHQIPDVCWMFGFAILFLIVLIIVRKFGTSNWWLPNFRGYLAMSMAWCLVRAEEWLMKLFWEDVWMARIWSAYSLSIFSVVCILPLNYLLNRTTERQRRSKAFAMCPEKLEIFLSTLNCSLRNGVDHVQAAEAAAIAADLDPNQQRELIQALEHSDMDKLMHRVVNGFTVVIGLAWDMGFEAAEELIVAPGIVSGPGVLQNIEQFIIDHHVLAKILLCFFIVAAVVPVWCKIFVPPARKHWLQHWEDIVRAEQLQVLVYCRSD